ncbi:DNA transposase THAP9 isoform X2 [Xenopus tropicalis]|uniref:DNA transposase THAP9 isoform X2 n=1 Tax=Xenopus tropicalis TaxID=8364 RepID=A0A8J0R007_XENTR|nr:DNA transposase THAP9 isoform X2 [Xenopus tropicalis]
MPVSCAASGCKSRYTLDAREKGITFHRFPRSNPALLEKWRLAMRRSTRNGELWMPSRYQRLCSLHFKQCCFDTTGQTKRLREHVIPTIFDFPEETHEDACKIRPEDTAALSTSCSPQKPEAEKVETAEPDEESGPEVEVVPANKKARHAEEVSAKNDVTITFQVPLQDHLYFIPDIETLKKKLHATEDLRARKEKELRNVKDKEKRQREAYRSIYEELGKRILQNPQLHERLQPFGDIPLELYKKPKSQYSAQQRLFCLTLHLHDQLLYRYLKNEIRLPIPDPRQLHKWLKTDDHNAGINSSVIETLLKKRKEQPKMYTSACLIVDTMSICQHLTYDSKNNELIGFVNLGKGANGSISQEVANETLIFMLVGMDSHWSALVAYFFIKTLTAGAQHQLLLGVMHELSDNGFEIVCVTMERHERNEEMCALLGCTFDDPKNLRSSFSLPDSQYKHYIMFDVNKEQQMVSDMLEEAGNILSPEGPVIWQYITDLLSLDKMSLMHTSADQFSVDAEPQLMKIKLMVNKIDSSVANALNVVNDLNLKMFKGSAATVSFIKILDRLFKLLSSRNPWAQGEREAITHSNLLQKMSVLQETEEYLLKLATCDNTFVYQGVRRHYILGLLVNITSLQALLVDLLHKQNYILTNTFSTDHIKKVFNSVRRAGERHKKPTAIQVKHAMDHLQSRCVWLHKYEHSWALKNEMCCAVSTVDSVPCSYEHPASLFLEDCVMLPDHTYSSNVLDVMVQNSGMYIAGWIVRKAFNQLTCNQCRLALVTNSMPQDFRNAYHLLQIKDSRSYFVPSNGTIKVIFLAEKSLNFMLKDGSFRHKHACHFLEYSVLSLLGSADVFELKEHASQTAGGIDNHYFDLLRLITWLYYTFRQLYVKRITRAVQYKAHLKQIFTKPRFYFSKDINNLFKKL